MDNSITKQHKERRIKEGFLGEQKIVLPPNIRRKIIHNALTKNFFLTAIGYYPLAAFHEMERKAGCKQFILIYCVEGEGTICLQNEQFVLTPNSYFIIPKNTAHRYFASANNPWTIYWVHFCGDYDQQLYYRFLSDGKPAVRHVPYEERRIKLFQQVYQLLETSYDMPDMEFMNLNLLHFVSSMVYHREKAATLEAQDKVSQSISYMKKNLHAQLSISNLAQQQQLSVSQYCRLFKDRTGHSPIQYFNQVKVQTSCQHLYFSDKSIKEICSLFGIADQFYFSRLFTKLMGMSPAHYRRTHR